ncbi:hypothetical protein [uncultured Gammaproteobacteria bacterium]|nr:hypothetical protein [uncultured Gammaproteobacteria bacterium]CAC9998169.1 hypothetical protein [uncultured Gammaproteobacteria bacterium]CAC9999439.1 hypothetical protein [uncultured Gammaproteobacteria bacterium]
MGWFFRILIGIFWVGWFYFWIWVSKFLGALKDSQKNLHRGWQWYNPIKF